VTFPAPIQSVSYVPRHQRVSFIVVLTRLLHLCHALDHTNSNSLSHITDGETSEGRIISEGLNTHWLGWNHLDDGSITRLDEFRAVLNGFTGTTINLLQDLSELAGNVGSVAVENWGVSGTNLTGVVQDNDLSVE
jgi:hypothetical protein